MQVILSEYEGISIDDNLQDEMPVDELGERDNDNLENAPIDGNEISVTGSDNPEGDAKPVYKFKILESDGQPIVNVQVKLRIVGKVYTVYTNAAGEGSLKLNLKPGSYPITIQYGKKSLSKNIKLFSSRVSVKNLCSIYGTPVQYQAKVVDNWGRPLKIPKYPLQLIKKFFMPKLITMVLLILS